MLKDETVNWNQTSSKSLANDLIEASEKMMKGRHNPKPEPIIVSKKVIRHIEKLEQENDYRLYLIRKKDGRF